MGSLLYNLCSLARGSVDGNFETASCKAIVPVEGLRLSVLGIERRVRGAASTM